MGEGARKFLDVLGSPEYDTARNEISAMEANQEKLRAFIGQRPVVVLGCGNGRKLAFLAPPRSKSITLVDLSERLIREAERNLGFKVKAMNADFESMDFSVFDPGTAFVMLGGTLGNLGDIRSFLGKIREVPSSRLVLGLEFLEKNGPDEISPILREYDNETGFGFVFGPLASLGVRRQDGEIQVSFNRSESRVEEHFVFSDARALERLANLAGVEADKVRRMLLSSSLKTTFPEFCAILESGKMELVDSFGKRASRICLVERSPNQ
ncbi:MAG: L-histidine N(alpha)-methyltransferase [Candidatus ainarchaeum sp.]|nr:L-histidine N(alpha)-methyltransferase [Candidatus ainarchaeum sp.]